MNIKHLSFTAHIVSNIISQVPSLSLIFMSLLTQSQKGASLSNLSFRNGRPASFAEFSLSGTMNS